MEKSQQPGVQPDQSQPSLKTEGKTTLSHVSQSTQTVPTVDRPEQELDPGEKSQQPGVQTDQSQPSLKTEGKTTLSHVSQSTQTVPTADRPEQELDPGEKSQQPGVQPDQSQPSLKTEGKTTLSHVSQSTQPVPTADRPEQELDPGEKSQQSGGQPNQSQPSLKTVEETLTDEGGLFTWTELRQARLPEYTLFHAMTLSIDRQKGQPFTERHERMLREIVYTDMADSELVKVLEWMHLHRHDCKSLEKIVLQMLYHKRHSVSREFVDWSRCIIVVGGLVHGQPSDETSVIAARTTLGGQLGSFKTLNNPLGTHDVRLYAGRCVWHPDLGVMFYCGGWTIPGEPDKRCWMYNPATGKWYHLQPMSKGRSHFPLHVLPSGRYIMAVGGWGEGRSLLSECEQFDLVTQTWHRVCSLPAGRCSHAGVVCDDVLYVTGGDVGNDSPTTDTVLVYGEVKDTWQDAPPMLHARACHSAGTIPGSVVVCGGMTRPDHTLSNDVIDVLPVEKFDTATRQWTIITHLDLGHSLTQGVCIDHRLLLLGGVRNLKGYSSGKISVRDMISDVTVVDMTDGKVTLEPDKLPSAVSQAAVCMIRLPESVIDN